MASGHFCKNTLDWLVSNRKGVCLLFLLLPCFTEIPVLNASRDDQTAHDVASDSVLLRLPNVAFVDASAEWIKCAIYSIKHK